MNNPELSIIKLFLDYDQWCKHKDRVSVDDFDKQLQGVVRTLYAYHENNGRSITLDDLANLFFATNPKNREFFATLFSRLETLNASEDTTVELIKSLQRNRVLRELALDAYDCAQGSVPLDKVLASLRELDKQETVDPESEADYSEFVVADLDSIANATYRSPGLRWRLDTLNKMFGSLRKGDFGFIFARPESGKTTFLASECTYMAEQIPDDAGPILWFNNEEEGKKVLLRCYQACIGATTTDLFRDIPGHQQEFMRRTRGKLLIRDSANITKREVEALCAKYKPSLIVFDQIDKIQGFQNDREDLRLGAIYLWAREIAKKYCPTIGVSQADGTGEGVRWLTMQHVANAKTAKQAEADFILGIGKVHDPGFESIRFLHASKNKLLGDEDTLPELRHGHKQVLINPDIARYEDIP